VKAHVSKPTLIWSSQIKQRNR